MPMRKRTGNTPTDLPPRTNAQEAGTLCAPCVTCAKSRIQNARALFSLLLPSSAICPARVPSFLHGGISSFAVPVSACCAAAVQRRPMPGRPADMRLCHAVLGCASLFPYVRFAFLFRGLSSFVISLPPRFSLPCLPFRFPPLCFRQPCTFSLPARFSCVCPCSPGKMPSYIAGARDALYPCFFRRIV